MRGLDEEERLLAPVAPHFLLMLDIVAPDAKDAAHRKGIVRAEDGQRRRGPDWNHVGHAVLFRKLAAAKCVAQRTGTADSSPWRKVRGRSARAGGSAGPSPKRCAESRERCGPTWDA